MLLGYVAIVTASVLWSLSPALISRYRRYIKPITFTGLRAAIATITLGSLLLGRDTSLNLSPPSIIIVVSSALIGPGIGDVFYVKSIQILGGFLAVILAYTYIFTAQALAVLALGESMKIVLVTGSLISFTGVVVAVSSSVSGFRFKASGIACAIITSITWGVSTLMVKVALGFVDELALTTLRLLTISTAFLPLGLLSEGPPPKDSVKSLLFAAALTATLDWTVGMYFFVHSINVIGVSATAVATALTPVLSTITTKALAREKPSIRSIAGALLTSTGILITAL
ncbi:MAG: DMT family transporter [Zestosphaera sp.]